MRFFFSFILLVAQLLVLSLKPLAAQPSGNKMNLEEFMNQLFGIAPVVTVILALFGGIFLLYRYFLSPVPKDEFDRARKQGINISEMDFVRAKVDKKEAKEIIEILIKAKEKKISLNFKEIKGYLKKREKLTSYISALEKANLDNVKANLEDLQKFETIGGNADEYIELLKALKNAGYEESESKEAITKYLQRFSSTTGLLHLVKDLNKMQIKFSIDDIAKFSYTVEGVEKITKALVKVLHTQLLIPVDEEINREKQPLALNLNDVLRINAGAYDVNEFAGNLIKAKEAGLNVSYDDLVNFIKVDGNPTQLVNVLLKISDQVKLTIEQLQSLTLLETNIEDFSQLLLSLKNFEEEIDESEILKYILAKGDLNSLNKAFTLLKSNKITFSVQKLMTLNLHGINVEQMAKALTRLHGENISDYSIDELADLMKIYKEFDVEKFVQAIISAQKQNLEGISKKLVKDFVYENGNVPKLISTLGALRKKSIDMPVGQLKGLLLSDVDVMNCVKATEAAEKNNLNFPLEKAIALAKENTDPLALVKKALSPEIVSVPFFNCMAQDKIQLMVKAAFTLKPTIVKEISGTDKDICRHKIKENILSEIGDKASIKEVYQMVKTISNTVRSTIAEEVKPLYIQLVSVNITDINQLAFERSKAGKDDEHHGGHH